MKERRRYERHIAVLPGKIEPMLTSGEKKVFDVETRNISLGGAFIYSEDLSFFQKGRRVIIDFTIPRGRFFKYLEDLKSLLDGEGSMVRSTPEGIGIHFDREF
jgi:c-di-GMP-binding flagellar brake protein YcgR